MVAGQIEYLPLEGLLPSWAPYKGFLTVTAMSRQSQGLASGYFPPPLPSILQHHPIIPPPNPILQHHPYQLDKIDLYTTSILHSWESRRKIIISSPHRQNFSKPTFQPHSFRVPFWWKNLITVFTSLHFHRERVRVWANKRSAWVSDLQAESILKTTLNLILSISY